MTTQENRFIVREYINRVLQASYKGGYTLTLREIINTVKSKMNPPKITPTVHANWAKHCEISFWVAAHDIDMMALAMGETLTLEFITLKMSGDVTTSLNQFCKDNGLDINWTEYL